MMGQSFLNPGEHKKWTLLQSTIGHVRAMIDKDLVALSVFLRGFDVIQRATFKSLTGVDITDSFAFTSLNKTSVRLLLLKAFVNNIGLDVIKEARPGIGSTEEDIYLNLLSDLAKEKYPEDIFAYAEYRRRGTPVSWLDIGQIDSDEARKRLHASKHSIVRSLMFKMKMVRDLVMIQDVNELTLLVLKKPRKAIVVTGARRNVEVSGGSYTIIVLDTNKMRIGVVTGNVREIGAIYSHLRNKVYKDLLAPARNEVDISGKKVFKRLIKKLPEDGLVLQGIELSKTALPDNASVKLRVNGSKSLDETLETVDGIVTPDTSVTDLKSAEYLVNGNKNISIYTGSDDWERVYINTSTKRITEALESDFIGQINNRLKDGIDIKKARLVVSDLNKADVIKKLLKDKKVSLNPPIPERAEEVLVSLKRMRMVRDAGPNTKRMCYNCWYKSWDKWLCPNCDRSDMRIIGEYLGLSIDDMAVLRHLSKASFGDEFDVKYHNTRQRKKMKKPVIEVHNNAKNITTYLLVVSRRRDLKFISELWAEGTGVVALIDPKMFNKIADVEITGASVVLLENSITAILENHRQDDVLEMIQDQEDRILGRIFDNAKNSINRLRAKATGFDERDFEIDISNIIQMLVPDVIWLGAKHTGMSVPDGYCRYKVRPRQMFAWDAKYSETGKYRLGKKDIKKQKGYIDWLTDPKKEPSKLAPLSIYAIISNFDEPKDIRDAVEKVSNYTKLPPNARLAIVDEAVFVLVGEWLQTHWKQVITNNSKVADELFKWFKRKQAGKRYTITRAKDWPYIEARLNKLLPK